MARIDFIALQQRLAQQQPKPATTMPAEPPSWSTRPTPASALRTTPAPKAPPATTSAATLTGTLRATTTMRATRPLKATSAREERARANALQAQIDELNAALAGANAEADRLKERVEALSVEVVRAERQAAGAEARAGRAEAATAGERSRADVLRDRVDGLQQDLLASQAVASELMAGRALMMGMHARELAIAQHDTLAAQQAAAELRQADNARKARGGLLTRLKAAWRGIDEPSRFRSARFSAPVVPTWQPRPLARSTSEECPALDGSFLRDNGASTATNHCRPAGRRWTSRSARSRPG